MRRRIVGRGDMGSEQATYLLLSDVPTTTGPDPLGFDAIAVGLARSMVASRTDVRVEE
jgi:hypothetical protein